MNLLRVLKSSLLLFALQLASPANAEDGYTFAVAPQYEQRKLFAIWQPVVDELSRRTGYKLKLAATLTVPEFESELAKGRFGDTGSTQGQSAQKPGRT